VNPEPAAITAASATVAYLAVTWHNGNATYGTLLRWTSTTGWSELSNAHMLVASDQTGDIKSISYISDSLGYTYLFVGGIIQGAFGTGYNVTAEGIGRYAINGGATWLGQSSGLYIGVGIPYVVKAANWGGGTSGNRTYYYVGGEVTSAGGGSVANIFRTYYDGTYWHYETMNGGIPNVTGMYGSKVFDIAVDPAFSNDTTYGNRHRVYAGGNFTLAGSSTAATNITYWTENTSTWTAMGHGIHIVGGDANCNPVPLDGSTYPGGWVNSIGYSSGNAFVVGTFNQADSTQYTVPSPPGYSCPLFQPLGVAKIASGSLGSWGGKGAWKYGSFDFWTANYADLWSVTANSTNSFIACGKGAMVMDANGNYPSSSTLTAPAYRVYGTTWEAIEANSDNGQPAAVEYLRASTAAPSSAFFIVNDSNGPSIRRYYYH
jgi:hypothetical protein